MDNKRNPDRDRMLEDILNDFGNEYKKNNQSEHSVNRYNNRNVSSRPTPRKTINQAALNNGSKTTGFAVSKISEDKELHDNFHVAETAKIDLANTSNYEEHTINIKRKIKSNEFDSLENYKKAYNDEIELKSNRNNKHEHGSNPNENYDRPLRRKRRKKASARLPIVLMVTTLILTVSIVLSILIIAVGRDMLAIGKGDMIKMITIPKGANASTVASLLKEEKIIEIPKAFEVFADLNGSDEKFIPGQYELSPSDAYETIIEKLTTKASDDDRESVTVTFIEGTSIYDAAKILEENGVCEAERFIYYFNAGGYNFDFESLLPKSTATKFYRMEGYLFPDTYKFYVNSEPESVCMKIYQNFENRFTKEHREQLKKSGMTLDEVITLASIVQAEAPTQDSMKKVAGVFLNRLENEEEFPMLQSDPTTYYVDEIIKPNIPVPSNAIFEAYDTYQGHGLPPGAIGNPGLDAIEAVLYPDENDYYYFCADIDTMEIFYAETLEEHEEYLAQINGESSDDSDGGENDYE